MKISIIVPIYNSEKYIKRCIESIINQTFTELEIILIDDGSNDKSGEICDKYKELDDRIIVKHIQNSGVSTARNIGIDLATGDYITFIDSDDYINKNTFKQISELIEKLKVDILKYNFYKTTGIIKIKNRYTVETEKIISIKENEDEIVKSIFEKHDLANVWNAVIKRGLIENTRFNKNLISGEDRLFMATIALKAKTIYFYNNALYYYYIHKTSATNMHKYDKSIQMLSSNITAKKIIYNQINEKKYKELLINGIIFDYKNFITNQNILKSYEDYKEKIEKLLISTKELDKNELEILKLKLFEKETYKIIKREQYIQKIKNMLIM